MQQEYCLITGASAGLGYEFSKILASKNKNLVMIAKNPTELLESANNIRSDYDVFVISIAVDLSKPENVIKVFDKLEKEKVFVSVLINNAGFGSFGSVFQTKWQTESEMIEVNIKSLILFCKLFGEKMVKEKRGKILNVASMAAFVPDKNMSVYNATKSFVLSYTYSLSLSFSGTGVSVTALCHCPTRTNFIKRAGIHHARLFKDKFLADPRIIAEKGVAAMERGSLVEIPGKINSILIFFEQLLPKKISFWIYEMFNK